MIFFVSSNVSQWKRKDELKVKPLTKDTRMRIEIDQFCGYENHTEFLLKLYFQIDQIRFWKQYRMRRWIVPGLKESKFDKTSTKIIENDDDQKYVIFKVTAQIFVDTAFDKSKTKEKVQFDWMEMNIDQEESLSFARITFSFTFYHFFLSCIFIYKNVFRGQTVKGVSTPKG